VADQINLTLTSSQHKRLVNYILAVTKKFLTKVMCSAHATFS